jgi:hypothetical protein
LQEVDNLYSPHQMFQGATAWPLLTIRCTHKLLTRLDAEVLSEQWLPTNRLGDWYANLLLTRRAWLIIGVSERSLLPVIVKAKHPASFIPRFREQVLTVLRRMGAASDVLDREAREMAQTRIGATASRRLLGSLNDFASLARVALQEHPEIDLVKLALELADTPCAPLKYVSPRSMSLTLLRRVHS